ncbi:hypothetical protein P9112_013707 [Eukaryota sp. TZLM1-RC]
MFSVHLQFPFMARLEFLLYLSWMILLKHRTGRIFDKNFCQNRIFFSPSLSQPSHISLSVTASQSYCVFAKTMPVTDSDSDTDWNAQAKILPIRSSSSPSLLHSPHPSSYARKSSQKNLKIFKKDFLPSSDAPDITPEKVQKRRYTCSKCGKVGHNIRKCPDIITGKMRLKTNISIVNSLQTPSELNLPPVPNVSADDVNYDLNIDQTHLPKTVAPDPTDNVLKHSCPFCKKFLSNSSNGRPLLFCYDCQTSDSLRTPVKIPVEVSPASSVPLSMEMRSFSSQLKLNKWNITRFWKFFAKKNKKKINYKPKQGKANSSFQARKLFLRGRYGSGLKNIFSGKLADTNLETVEKLKSLHPTEHFCPSKPSICQYWLENPFQAQEVLNAVAKLPKGKAAGPSGISFDLLKTACKNAPEIVEDLASYFQNLMCLNYVPPPELTAARLVALVKPGKGDKPDGVRPIAIGESLTRLLSSLIFNRISTKARDYLKPFQFGIKNC